MPRVGTIVAQSRDYRCPESGLSLPRVGTIVARTFFTKLSPCLSTRASVSLVGLCTPNKIYEINYVPARLTATGRLLRFLAFVFFLDAKLLQPVSHDFALVLRMG